MTRGHGMEDAPDLRGHWQPLHKGATVAYLGRSIVDYGDPLHVFAELSLVDDLNDHERQKETTEHETVRYGDVPSVSITWHYGTLRELRRGDGSGGAGIDPETLAGLEDDGCWCGRLADDPAHTGAGGVRTEHAHETRGQAIATLGERWHLNTMRAGCAHQTVVWEDTPYHRPSLERTKPCPETGYRYGSSWLVELVPAEVVTRLRELFAA